MEMMAPEHPRWNEFIDILLGPRGCNVTVHDDEDEPFTWECENNFRRTEAILESMGGFDVKASINHLHKVYRVESDYRILADLEDERLFERWEQEEKSRSRSPRLKD